MKEDDDKVKLWRELNDGVYWINRVLIENSNRYKFGRVLRKKLASSFFTLAGRNYFNIDLFESHTARLYHKKQFIDNQFVQIPHRPLLQSLATQLVLGHYLLKFSPAYLEEVF